MEPGQLIMGAKTRWAAMGLVLIMATHVALRAQDDPTAHLRVLLSSGSAADAQQMLVENRATILPLLVKLKQEATVSSTTFVTARRVLANLTFAVGRICTA